MPRITYKEIENYQSGESDFFQLKNDKDTTVVHFLAESADDIDVMVVHKTVVGDKNRYINCLRTSSDPIDYCPLCASGNKPMVRVFVQMLDLSDNKIKIWDRGAKILHQIDSLARRVRPLYATPIEIERNGKAGDQKTTYAFYPLANDKNYPERTLEELPERVEICGVEKAIVLEKTYEELEELVSGGATPRQDITPRRGADDQPTGATTPTQTSSSRLGGRRIRRY